MPLSDPARGIEFSREMVAFADRHWDTFFQSRFTGNPSQNEAMGKLLKEMLEKDSLWIRVKIEKDEPYIVGYALLLDNKYIALDVYASKDAILWRIRPTLKAFHRMAELVNTDWVKPEPIVTPDQFVRKVDAQTPLTRRIVRRIREALLQAA